MNTENEAVPEFLVANSAVNWVKTINPSMALEEDEEVRQHIRKLVREAWAVNGVEEYWELDPQYGKQKNTVVPIQVGHPHRGKSYAIVRESDNGLIVITLISEKRRQEALMDRWSPVPFEPKRTRGSSESINKPFEQLADAVKDIEIKNTDYIVSYKDKDGDEEVMFIGDGRRFHCPIECITSLLQSGVNLSSITVWQKKHIKIDFSVSVKGL